jgi:hypothetical protein
MTAHCKLALIYVKGPRTEPSGLQLPQRLMSALCQ